MTKLLLIATFIGLILYDIYVYLDEDPSTRTITSVIRKAPKWVFYALGFISGHLFWP